MKTTPKKHVLGTLLVGLWIFSFGLALGPLLLMSDQQIISQFALIKNSSYFQDTYVDYRVVKDFAIKLFTLNPELLYSLHFDGLLLEVSNSDSWKFMEKFASKWSESNFQFKKFIG